MSYTIWPDGEGGEAVEDVYAERLRQEELCASGKFPWTCAHEGPTDEAKLSVLAEEFGEVAKMVTESLIDKGRRDPEALREELIQTAAVACAWAEALAVEMRK